MNNCGIYKITNLINNKFYIGSSFNVDKRLLRHKLDLNKNKHPNEHLQRSWNKYREIKFKFELIHICKKEELIQLEQKYINELNPEYNICKIAGTCLGIKRSEKTKELQSKIRQGIKFSEETRRKMSEAKLGKSRPFTEEHKQNISKALKNKKVSEQTKVKLSNIHKNRPWSNKRREAQNKKKESNE